MQCIDSSEEIIKMSYGDKETVAVEEGKEAQSGGDTCPNCIDTSTVERNIPLIGGRATYAGGDNPMTLSGKYSYSYVPTMLTDYPAIDHDRRYDNLGTVGFMGLLMDTRAIGADWKFVNKEWSMAVNPYMDPVTRINAGLLGFGLGLIALPKTIIQYAQPNGTGHGNVMMWYYISNTGVTNTPSIHNH
ncbi:hypothetical protein [Saccharicrinis fermentans]|nr:hypothetical protein [Saccharicrinis fermentans]